MRTSPLKLHSWPAPKLTMGVCFALVLLGGCSKKESKVPSNPKEAQESSAQQED